MLMKPAVFDRLMAESSGRLTFEPSERRRELESKRPLENETPERIQRRLAYALAETTEHSRVDLERILGGNDLMNVSYLERGLAAAAAVGRIQVRRENGDMAGFGTGFLVGPRVLMTNNHVLGDIAEARTSRFELNYQLDTAGNPRPSVVFALRPDDLFFTDARLDFTLVAVAPTAMDGPRSLAEFGWLKLHRGPGKALEGEFLTIIQHPSGGYKQLAVRENRLLKVMADFLWYMTDTAPGSSGSPVYNDSWQVVALHHSGVPETDAQGNYLATDGTVWTRDMGEGRIKWKANEGVRVSRIVEAVSAALPNHPLVKPALESAAPLLAGTASAPVRADGGRTGSEPTTATAPPGPQVLQSQAAGPLTAGSQIRVATPDGTTITIEVGSRSGPDRPQDATAPLTEAISIDPDYSNRKGYEPDFLGTGERSVPLPGLTERARVDASVRIDATGSDSHVLRYHHFSIVMNKKRRLAYFTAVNIDGRIAYSLKRDRDAWIFDPRIPKEDQLGEPLYKFNALDRGHLVRRLDPAWGASEEVARSANDDTFHFSNCSPQHHEFNAGQTLWAGLEDYILKNADARDFKVSVFTGPVFGENDPLYREVRLPKQFWKVVIMAKRGGQLSATAYLLSQASLLRDLEGDFTFGAYKTYQVPVRRIEELTKLDFGRLRAADPLASTESTGERELSDYSGVRL